jgi:hypothetical protein
MAWENYARLPPTLSKQYIFSQPVENNDKNNTGEIMKTVEERWKKLSHTE